MIHPIMLLVVREPIEANCPRSDPRRVITQFMFCNQGILNLSDVDLAFEEGGAAFGGGFVVFVVKLEAYYDVAAGAEGTFEPGSAVFAWNGVDALRRGLVLA